MSPEEEFWAMVDRSGGAEACWFWNGTRMISWQGRRRVFHHVAFELAAGRPLHKGDHVRHLCRTPACCNPLHLARPVMPGGNRFWSHVDKSAGQFSCWPWLGCITNDGHGQFNYYGKTTAAHRIAWELATGRLIPSGTVVRHMCNHPWCCNPAHLQLGTHADNVADRVRAGRSARGEQNGRARLTWDQVLAIRRAYLTQSETVHGLARAYGVSPKAIRYVIQGKHWTGGTDGEQDRLFEAAISRDRSGSNRTGGPAAGAGDAD